MNMGQHHHSIERNSILLNFIVMQITTEPDYKNIVGYIHFNFLLLYCAGIGVINAQHRSRRHCGLRSFLRLYAYGRSRLLQHFNLD